MVTKQETGGVSFEQSLQMEVEITPDQIGDFKLNRHQNFLKDYADSTAFSFDELWLIREECITTLQNT